MPATPGGAAPPPIGPVPEVGVGHAALLNDEPEKVWVLPTAEILDTITGKRERLAAEVRATGDKIVSTLQSFGIETRIVGANSGPTVTQYELQPAVGVPVRRILGYQTDLALALAAPIRIQPFIPGQVRDRRRGAEQGRAAGEPQGDGGVTTLRRPAQPPQRRARGATSAATRSSVTSRACPTC